MKMNLDYLNFHNDINTTYLDKVEFKNEEICIMLVSKLNN